MDPPEKIEEDLHHGFSRQDNFRQDDGSYGGASVIFAEALSQLFD